MNKDTEEFKQGSTNSSGSASSSSFVGQITSRLFGIKHKKRPIGSILSFRKYNSCEFSIRFQESARHEDTKELRYRTFRPDDCSQILAKLKFLVRAQGAKLENYSHLSNRLFGSAPAGTGFNAAQSKP